MARRLLVFTLIPNVLHRLISFGMPWQNVLPQLGILIVASILVGWAASKRFRFV